MQTRFSDDDLQQIIDQAAIYMCACPAQLCTQILGLRHLHAYQSGCIESGKASLVDTHTIIGQATQQAHDLLEQTLDQVLTLEGWDRQSLQMPADLRRIRDDAISIL